MSNYLLYTLKSEWLMSFCFNLRFNVYHLQLSTHEWAVLPSQRTPVTPLVKLGGRGWSYKRYIPQDVGTTQRLVPRSARPLNKKKKIILGFTSLALSLTKSIHLRGEEKNN